MSPFMLLQFLQVMHQTKRFIILDSNFVPISFLPPDEGEGNVTCSLAIDSCTAKWTLAVRLALWHFRIIHRDVKTCWGKRTVLVTWLSCEWGWRGSSVGRSESTPGPHNDFLPQEYWSLSQPLCGWFSTAELKWWFKQAIHIEEEEGLPFSTLGRMQQGHGLNSNSERDNSYCLSPKHHLTDGLT